MADRTDEDNGDYLGYSVYAETLWHRIEAALNKDVAHREAALREDKTPPPLGDDPLVVGLFGEWGAGKSKLLSLIQKLAEAQRKEQIEEHKLDGYKAITVPVFFQPWKYEHEKHLLVPLLLHILIELESTLGKARNGEDKATGAALAVVEGAKSALGSALKKVGDLTKAVGQVMGVADPVTVAPIAGIAQVLAHSIGGLFAGKAKLRAAREFVHSDNGRSYYEMHRILSEVTRPAKSPHVAGDQHHDKDFCINFAIFIDDLDRCLPEKAVETLELIKTVFNLESFAFVLALDEEVVERGIGHRYKDYALQDKKPEMPITGFEYLEKIVHIPFRLPGLSPQKALQFLQMYEEEHVLSIMPKGEYQPQAWMCERGFELHTSDPLYRGEVGVRGGNLRRGEEVRKAISVTLNLAALVVNSFDAHVPRKLIRVVELFHQTLAVLTHRGKFEQVVPGGLIDPRVLMTFVLLQLFQPDLYRACRRSLTGFNVLLDAMREPEDAMRESRPAAQSLGRRTSDADLWHWAVGWVGDRPPVSHRAALLRIPDLQPVERHEAQRIQLPLASRLVEHRATQRHVFDPMRLFEQLRPLHDELRSQAINSSTYFGVLALAGEEAVFPDEGLVVLRKKDSLVEALRTHGLEDLVADTDTGVLYGSLPGLKGRFEAYDLDELHAVLTSGQESEKDRLYKQTGLTAGETLSSEREEALLSRLEAEAKQLNSVNVQELPLWRSRVLHGLTYLAPHFDRARTGSRWWDLVKDAAREPSADSVFRNKELVLLHARWMDVRGALGQDQRFDTERFSLPFAQRSQSVRDAGREPIPGFVRVFGDDVQSFRPFGGPAVALQAFYMARHLTTVDQYARFVEHQGYGNPEGEKPDWWDTLGWLWRTGRWNSQVKDKVYRDVLAARSPELRSAPMTWSDQLRHGSRPVLGVNWFEARAYASWLTSQLRDELTNLPTGYSIRLPTEAQWERAARARDAVTADDRQFPWGGSDPKTAHLLSNISTSDIGQPSVVGLFPPNSLGISDLSGNVWEWQNNLCHPNGRGQHDGLISDVSRLQTHQDLDRCDCPALRGGAWNGPAVNARASFRHWNLPDLWHYVVGFRVVLSRAE
jgi:formylglycine-generating enzyme required for sulfatase activity